MEKYKKDEIKKENRYSKIAIEIAIVGLIFVCIVIASDPVGKIAFQNELKAAALLKKIYKAQETFKMQSINKVYASRVKELSIVENNKIVEGNGEILHGYKLGLLNTKPGNTAYSITIYPVRVGFLRSGNHSLFIDQTGIIRCVWAKDGLLDERSREYSFFENNL